MLNGLSLILNFIVLLILCPKMGLLTIGLWLSVLQRLFPLRCSEVVKGNKGPKN